MISQRIRIGVNFRSRDPITDLLTSKAPELWLGTDVRFEHGFLDGTILADDISNLASVTLEVFAASRSGLPYMAKTISAADLLDSLTQEQWDDGAPEHSHAVFEFTAAETALPMEGQLQKTFWYVISCLTNNGTAKRYTLSAGEIRFLQDGTPSDQVGAVQGGNVIPGGAAYNAEGEYTLTGLTVNKLYKWSPGAHDDDLTSGAQTLVAEGNFTAQATTALLTGDANQPVTAIVRSAVTFSAEEADARYLKANVPAWADDIQFFQGELCSDQGGVWIAEEDSEDEAPPELPTESNAYWRCILLPGSDGADGANAYLYIAYATAADGTGFNLASGGGRNYIAFRRSAAPLTPVVGDFGGLWEKYIGTNGDPGTDGLNAYTTTTASFVMPALNATVNVAVVKSAWATVGQNVFVATAGTLQVTGKPDATTLTLKNLGYTGNAAPAVTIATAQQISPGGIKGTDGNGGDMTLAGTQTVTGPKSYADQTAKILNTAGDQATSLRSAATAARTATLPDRSGVLALAPSPAALVWAEVQQVDFASELWRSITVGGATSFSTINRGAGRYLLLDLTGGAEDYPFTWPAWKSVGEPAPASLKAGKKLQVELWCYGNTEADVVARYHMEGSFTSCQTLAISAEDDTNINPAADFAWHTVVVAVESDLYDEPFTHDLFLKTLNASAGDHIDILFNIEATLHPTIRVWNNTTGEGGGLVTIKGAAYEQHIKAEFLFIDGAWGLLKWSYVDGKMSGNRFSRAPITYAEELEIDFDGPCYQELEAEGDLLISTANRADTGVTKAVAVLITATAACDITFADGIHEVGTWIVSLAEGESLWLGLTSNGPDESNTEAATAPRV